jgi:hypothetical protein
MAYNEEYWTLVSAKAELEEYMSPRLPDEEMLIPGPSLLGLAEQRNKILVHLKKQGVEVPEHLVSPPLDEFPRTRQDPSLHMTLLLMWVGEQGILLPPALYKTSKFDPFLYNPRLLTVHRTSNQSQGSSQGNFRGDQVLRSFPPTTLLRICFVMVGPRGLPSRIQMRSCHEAAENEQRRVEGLRQVACRAT